VERVREASDRELKKLLENCFDVEDRSWKGDNGTSIRKTPGLADYYLREARLMRDAGMLDLWLMRVDGELIAFEYCHFAKGICFSHKISFDPRWDRFSPGRLLRCFQLQHYHDDSDCHQLDTLGVLCSAKGKWVTRKYRSATCRIALGGPAGNLLVGGLSIARDLKRKLRQAEDGCEVVEPGAARYLEIAERRKSSHEKAASPPAIVPALPAPAVAPESTVST